MKSAKLQPRLTKKVKLCIEKLNYVSKLQPRLTKKVKLCIEMQSISVFLDIAKFADFH